MKTQLPSAIILCALLLVLSLHAFAAGNQTTHVSSSGTSHGASNASALLANALGTRYTGYTITIQPTAAGEAAPTAALLSDASSRTCSAGTMAVEGETYLAAAPVLRALYPGLAVTEQADTLSAQGDDLHLEALAGEAYFTVNDRCFYVPRFVQAAEGQVYLPLDTFAEALGCTPSTDPTTGDLRLSQTGAPATAPIYPEEDLYWLSRAIYSESGNQPMAGRIAVGTVILNRVADPAFPDTIKDVVFAPRQFSPVANGTIYHDPDERSVVAAKLCLDGVREAEPCLYFNVTTMYSWADRSRTYYCTIGGHNFYL